MPVTIGYERQAPDMDGTEQQAEHSDARGMVAAVLTPGALAITAFTLAVLTASGQNAMNLAVQSFFGTAFGFGEYGWIVATSGVTSAFVAVGAILIALRVVGRSAPAAVSWELHLARAAVIIAAFAGVCAVLTVIGGVVARS